MPPVIPQPKPNRFRPIARRAQLNPQGAAAFVSLANRVRVEGVDSLDEAARGAFEHGRKTLSSLGVAEQDFDKAVNVMGAFSADGRAAEDLLQESRTSRKSDGDLADALDYASQLRGVTSRNINRSAFEGESLFKERAREFGEYTRHGQEFLQKAIEAKQRASGSRGLIDPVQIAESAADSDSTLKRARNQFGLTLADTMRRASLLVRDRTKVDDAIDLYRQAMSRNAGWVSMDTLAKLAGGAADPVFIAGFAPLRVALAAKYGDQIAGMTGIRRVLAEEGLDVLAGLPADMLSGMIAGTGEGGFQQGVDEAVTQGAFGAVAGPILGTTFRGIRKGADALNQQLGLKPEPAPRATGEPDASAQGDALAQSDAGIVQAVPAARQRTDAEPAQSEPELVDEADVFESSAVETIESVGKRLSDAKSGPVPLNRRDELVDIANSLADTRLLTRREQKIVNNAIRGRRGSADLARGEFVKAIGRVQRVVEGAELRAARKDLGTQVKKLRNSSTRKKGIHSFNPEEVGGLKNLLATIEDEAIPALIDSNSLSELRRAVRRGTRHMRAADVQKMAAAVKQLIQTQTNRVRSLRQGKKDSVETRVAEFAKALKDRDPIDDLGPVSFGGRARRVGRGLAGALRGTFLDIKRHARFLDGGSGPLSRFYRDMRGAYRNYLADSQSTKDQFRQVMQEAGFNRGSKEEASLSEFLLGRGAVRKGKVPVQEYRAKASDGAALKLSPAERIALAALAKNPENVAKITGDEGGLALKRDGANRVWKLSPEELDGILRSMPEQERAIADGMVRILNDEGPKAALDAVYRQATGSGLAFVDNYFPRRSVRGAKDLTDPSDLNGMLSRFKFEATPQGQGFTKSRTDAKSAILLEDAFEAFGRVTHQQAVLRNMALPHQALRSFLADPSTQALFNTKLGRMDRKLWDDFANAATLIPPAPSGTGIGASAENLIRSFQRKIPVAVLGNNPWVMAKQVGSWFLGANWLRHHGFNVHFPAELLRVTAGGIKNIPANIKDQATFNREVRDKLDDAVFNEMRSASPVLRERYDGTSVQFTTPLYGEGATLIGRRGRFEASMDGIKLMDRAVIQDLWKQVKGQIRQRNPELDEAGVLARTAHVIEELIEDTQPDFSPIGQTGLSMASKRNAFLTPLTMFTSFRAKAGNYMLQEAARAFKEARAGNMRPAAFALGGMTAAIVSNAVLMQLIDESRRFARRGFRKRDNAKEWTDHAIDGLSNTLGNFYAVQPLFEQLKSRIKGQRFMPPAADSELALASAIHNLGDGLGELVQGIGKEVMSDREKRRNKTEASEHFMRAVQALTRAGATFSGAPITTPANDAAGLFRAFNSGGSRRRRRSRRRR